MSAWTDFLADPDTPGQYLAEITVFDTTSPQYAGTLFMGEGVWSEVSPGDAPDFDTVSSNTSTLTYADKYWVGDPGDANKPNADYEARLAVPLTLERRVPIIPQSSPRIERTVGSMELLNGDGNFDVFDSTKSPNGRQVRVLFGPEGGAYSEFQVIADVLGVRWWPDELTTTLVLRPKTAALDRPIQSTLYAGTGGSEGRPELTDTPKPLSLGESDNITPVLIDPANLIYQVHHRAVNAISMVRDRMDELTDSGTDVSGYDNLVNQSVPAGNFATAVDVGMFKLGSSPDGDITCDVEGDATGGYVNTINAVCKRILEDFGGKQTADIDTSSFDGLTQTSDTIGIYISPDERPTIATILDRLLGGQGAFWGQNRSGQIRAGEVKDPSGLTSDLDLDESDILSITPEQPPTPRFRQRVNYNRNWTSNPPDIANSVWDSASDTFRQFIEDAWRFEASFDGDTRRRFPNARELPVLNSYFAASSAAQTLADNMVARHKDERQVFEVELRKVNYQLELGDVVNITYPRWGLDSGKNFMVVGISEDARRDEGILRVWG